MFRTALRNVLAHKARLLMTVLAVMLGVAFVSGTLVFTSTISDAFRTSSQKSFDNIDVAVTPASPDGPPGAPAEDRLDGRTLDTLTRLSGAASVTATATGFTGVGDKDGKLIAPGGNSRGSNYFPGKDGKDARYPMTQGTAPTRADQFALDAGTAAKGGYHVGDTVRISADGPVRQQKLTGIFTTDDGRVAAGGSLALFDTGTAQKLFKLSGGYSEIDVEAAAGTSQAALQQAIDKVLPKGSATTATGKELADAEAKVIDQNMQGMKTALLAFAAVALFVGIFLIANTFTMLVAQRTKELALMRAVGASRRQVTRSVLIEAFVVGAIAGVSGLVAGIGIAALLRTLLNGFVAKFPEGPLVVSPSTAVTALGIGTVITVLAAWLPARRGAKVPPVAAMNSVHAVATTKSLLVRNTLGAFVAGLGTASVLLATSVYEGDDTSKIMLGGGGMLLLVGVFILTPLLSRPLIALATPVLRFFGISGLLARQNALRNPRRTATTASALMIGLTLITGMTVIAGSTQKGIDKLAVDALKADYTISMVGHTQLPTTAEKRVREVAGVTALTPLREGMAKIGTGSAARPAQLTGVDGAQFGSLVRPGISEGSPGPLRGDRVLVDQDTATRNGWRAGSRFPVTFQDGKKSTLTVSGVYQGNQMLSGAYMDNRTLAPHQKDISDQQLLVKMAGGATDAHKNALVEALGKNPAVTVADKKDVSNTIASMFTLLLNMLYGLLAMAVIVAVLGVINTLAMSVFERSQEIGMLRAIGLDRRGIKRMVRLESLVISLFGGVLGIGLGVFMGWAVGRLISAHLSTYELVLPWGRLGLFLGLAALVGVLAALWPALRAARLNMLTAIKAE
ncbi:ABC transporter [Streptomyces glebosus]|uniref:ABC transporter n=1 Tax=Streptomyces glebosus TaxID=249580 RepID=A0A640SY82_9ACTN|nr:ABC transporter permease [Streptomyces glebosus]GFE16473.1 ABC transporter [Streptomyces glebosus]GHG79471.1 ABC transporter [Streptomyces glebosus]